jgi:RHS repeat-associated protein
MWDGNKLLHEWTELAVGAGKQAADEVLTWLFEDGSFAPLAKLQGQARYSILSDHLGTPVQMHDAQGQQVWAAELDSFGKVRKQEGEVAACPFRYQGQYEDVETGLYYNRFRYYDPEAGRYISQDPIKLWGGDRLYSYVGDPTLGTDALGLSEIPAGFKSFGQYRQFSQATQAGLARAGYPNTVPLMQGSAVTGVSHDTGVPFDVGRTSDYDIALANKDLYDKAESLGLAKGGKSRPIDTDELADQLGLGKTRQTLSKMSGRKVNFMIFEDKATAKAKGRSLTMPCKK